MGITYNSGEIFLKPTNSRNFFYQWKNTGSKHLQNALFSATDIYLILLYKTISLTIQQHITCNLVQYKDNDWGTAKECHKDLLTVL